MGHRHSFNKAIWGRLRSFTLIELLSAVAIIAILALVTVLSLNPSELLRETRDNTRVLDEAELTATISDFQGSLGQTSISYISIPDPNATSSLGTQCQSLGLPPLPSGWTYHCVGPTYSKNVDGTGWLPINFAGQPSGSTLGNLPVDPINSAAPGLYYAYATDGSQNFELTASMESAAYGKGGSKDKTSVDGGKYADLYETGSILTLAPTDYAGGSGYTGGSQGGYTFSGFQPPIKTDGSGIYNLGRTLPIKFSLTDSNNNYVTSVTAHLVVTNVQDGIIGDVPIQLATSTSDTGNLFRISGTQYIYNLDTGQLSPGTWQIKAVLDTGVSYAVLISVKNF
jgi:hypothetical protein